MSKTQTQVTLEDLTELLATVEMPPLTRHWVEEHLRDLNEDMGGAMSREEVNDLKEDMRDLEWRLSRVSDILY